VGHDAVSVIHGDCLEVMATLDAESIDAIVTDPPYGLEFMGKAWDTFGRFDPRDKATKSASMNRVNAPVGTAPTYVGGSMAQAFHARWAEAAYRVAKPSAYLLAFGGTRTVHRMTVALEDAGWIIRDMLVWGYASGFPKSKASLKPAWEPIVMARKPGPLRMLNIDECRIPVSAEDAEVIATTGGFMQAGWQGPDTSIYNKSGDVTVGATVAAGRWPANVVLTDPIFDGGIEGVVGGGETAIAKSWGPRVKPVEATGYDLPPMGTEPHLYGDSGTYSRFFLVPKAARSDREPVLGGLSGIDVDDGEMAFDTFNENVGNTVAARRRNVHPTVKPTELMRHLVRLVTPQGGTVLDPFLGSGTTALAAEMEGFAWIGIEREAEYVAIAEARLNGTQKGMAL